MDSVISRCRALLYRGQDRTGLAHFLAQLDSNSQRLATIHLQAEATFKKERFFRRSILNGVVHRTEERLRSANFIFRSRVAHVENNPDLRCHVMLLRIGEDLDTRNRIISSVYQPEVEDTTSDVLEIDVHQDDLADKMPPFIKAGSDPRMTSLAAISEAKCLRQWLRRSLTSKPRVVTRPRDADLVCEVCATAPDSVTHLLRNAMAEEAEDIAPSSTLFAAIGPLNSEFVKVTPYLKQCISKLMLEAYKEILMVFDVCGSKSSVVEAVGGLSRDVKATLLFAVDPTVKRNSAVLLRILKT